VQGELVAPAQAWRLEPDASAAAVALAAACLSDGELSIVGLTPSSLQSDVRIADYLARFGCRSEAGPDGLRAGGRPQRGAAIDLSGQPDLAPVLAAVGACAAWSAGDTTELSGLGTLANKESPRVAVLAAALRRLGLAIEATDECLRIAPGTEPNAAGLRLDAGGDHRMAFAFALLGLVQPGIEVADSACVAKSWPSFWEDLEAWGARTACYPPR
jgi:3-phosphoshikimate 1-carboxyvinyltransferase